MSKKSDKLMQQAEQAQKSGNREQARLCYEKVLAKEPRHLDARYLLGSLLAEQGRLVEARAHLEEAARLAPTSPYIQNNLGNLYLLSAQNELAERAYMRALQLQPRMTEALVNLRSLLSKRGALTESIATAERALAAAPDMLEAHVMLANACRDSGRIEQAIEHYRRALEIQAGHAPAATSLLMCMNYHPTATVDEVRIEHLAWGARLPEPLPRPAREHGKRLRIGYVSPDLVRHPVGYLMEALLASHDREHFDVHVYSDALAEDDVTARLRGHCEHWHNVAALDDDALTAVLRSDALDIAVDLAGHTAQHRLAVFARRVAPVQASYLGYCTTTGVPAMDYAISDADLDPTEADAAYYTERVWRLPRPSFAFNPDADFPEVGPLPALEAGHLIFGSFNNLSKISGPVLDLWAEVLRAIPDAGLLMQARALGDEGVRERIQGQFEDRGVPPERLVLTGFSSLSAHLKLFNHIDVCLDTFPWNGHMTTLDSLWMGVPVLTLAGDRRAARMGAAVLHAVGLDDFVTRTPSDFVERAVALDKDRAYLGTIRADLRRRLTASALADGAGLAREMEAAFRQMHAAAVSAASSS
ncbi:MAG TPA: tetratricopeptide repeat protein [Aromatoleum sp.]|uniref:O-linked N-acetylglucosamine transferase, SPINDLY family protein n=1 Tax=Aromatoleum sp. TaxID=2307007 RepID=UPI002B4A3BCD|nr:tetratricopeptide repeat protein [Aromatoleum sp.]HJV25394.1 tetratricopeptide repeat protein [Aromatoleum sp.]